MVSVESLSEEELKLLHEYYCNLNKLAQKEKDLYVSHTIEEAIENHKSNNTKRKKEIRKKREVSK